MMINAYYLNEEHVILLKNTITFSEMMLEVSERISNGFHKVLGYHKEKEENTIALYLYEDVVVLSLDFDDLVPEFNLDAFQKYSELRDQLKLFYKDSEIDLYINLKDDLPEYITNNLKPLSVSPGEYKRLSSIQSITFGRDSKKEVYSINGFSCYPEGTDYDINILGTNLDPNMLAISLVPEYGSRLARYNFRNLYDITDYVLCFSNRTQSPESVLVTNLIYLVSYKNYPRNTNV